MKKILLTLTIAVACLGLGCTKEKNNAPVNQTPISNSNSLVGRWIDYNGMGSTDTMTILSDLSYTERWSTGYFVLVNDTTLTWVGVTEGGGAVTPNQTNTTTFRISNDSLFVWNYSEGSSPTNFWMLKIH